MFFSKRRAAMLGVAITITACGDAGIPPTDPITGARAVANVAARTQITAMTRNLYLGADVFPVFAALASPDPADDLDSLLAAVRESQITAFPARVQALADEIARVRPHVVGLQEVSIIDIRLPEFVAPPAGVDIQLDFLALLQDALAARGLRYVVASAGSFSGLSLAPAPGIVISNIDRDVLLVDAARVSIVPGSAFGRMFTHNVGPVGGGLSLTRGFVGAKATIDGVDITVVNTHLESLVGEPINLLRAAQAAEVVSAIGSAPVALVLGDLNEGPASAMHGVFAAAGFSDSWADMRPGVEGLTCCHRSNLSNQTPVGVFSERIDYVLARGLTHTNGQLLGSVTLLGTTPGDRVQGPAHLLWPSDHAGLSAQIFMPPTH